MNKKAQHLIFASMLFFFIFLLVFAIFFDYLFANPKISGERHELLTREATRTANALLQPGYPDNWNLHTVTRIGIADKGRINQTKLNQFSALLHQHNGYERSKQLLGITNDYLIIVTQPSQPTITYGQAAISSEETLLASSAKTIATQTRTVTNPETGEPVTITIHLYQ